MPCGSVSVVRTRFAPAGCVSYTRISATAVDRRSISAAGGATARVPRCSSRSEAVVRLELWLNAPAVV